MSITIETIVELLSCLGRPTNPLPDSVDLDAVKLVRSNKGDIFYCVTAKVCSCPSFRYRGGPCKHQRKYFPEPKKTLTANDSEREQKAEWAGNFNGPVDPDTTKQSQGV